MAISSPQLAIERGELLLAEGTRMGTGQCWRRQWGRSKWRSRVGGLAWMIDGGLWIEGHRSLRSGRMGSRGSRRRYER